MSLFSRRRKSAVPDPPVYLDLREEVLDRFPNSPREARRELFAIWVFADSQRRAWEHGASNRARLIAAVDYAAAIEEPLSAWDVDPFHSGLPTGGAASGDLGETPLWYVDLEIGRGALTAPLLDAMALELMRRSDPTGSTRSRVAQALTEDDRDELGGASVFSARYSREMAGRVHSPSQSYGYEGDRAHSLHLANYEREKWVIQRGRKVTPLD